MTQSRVSASTRVHILVGDSRGGGRRFGTSRGKSEFPRSWLDDDIIAAIEDVANDPASIRLTGRRGRIILIGMRKSISIMVVANPETGFIVTGFPTER
jgi:EndoU nuclease-like protein